MAISDESLGTLDAGFDNLDDAAASFPGNPNDEPEGEDEEIDEGEEIEAEGDEPDADDDAPEGDDGEEEDEPEAPAIDPPVSWKDEAKEEFAKLPPAMQQLVAERESEREATLTRKSQEAAENRRAAESAAEKQSELTQNYAQQFQAVANAYAPRPLAEKLQGVDPQYHPQIQAQHDQEVAQYNQVIQHSQGLVKQSEADFEVAQQQWVQEQKQQLIQAVPEWSDQTKFSDDLKVLDSVGTELGYGPELMSEAGSVDILALRKAADWKAKADKWDNAMKKQMAPVRAAKNAKPNATQPKGSSSARRRKAANQRLQQTGSLGDAAAALPPMPK